MGFGGEAGGCIAPEKKWAFFEFLEYTMLPRICDNKIVLRRTSEKPPFFFVRYNMETGKKRVKRKLVDSKMICVPLNSSDKFDVVEYQILSCVCAQIQVIQFPEDVKQAA